MNYCRHCLRSANECKCLLHSQKIALEEAPSSFGFAVVEKSIDEVSKLELEIESLKRDLKLHRLRRDRDNLRKELEREKSGDVPKWDLIEAMKRQTTKG